MICKECSAVSMLTVDGPIRIVELCARHALTERLVEALRQLDLIVASRILGSGGNPSENAELRSRLIVRSKNAGELLKEYDQLEGK